MSGMDTSLMMDTTTDRDVGTGHASAVNGQAVPPRRQYTLEVERRIVEVSVPVRKGTTLGDQWVPAERLLRDPFDHSQGPSQLAVLARGWCAAVGRGDRLAEVGKASARYPQLYSRVGFVHEFKPLSQADVRQLLRDGWGSAGVSFSDETMIDDEALAMLIRVAEGRFRLLHRLLTQISRLLEINNLDRVTTAVVAAARESLVIGTA